MTHEQKRLSNIGRTTAYIGKLLDDEKPIDFRVCIFKVMEMLGISRRTATEYVELAFSRLKIKK